MKYDNHEYQPASPTTGGCQVCGLSRHNPVHEELCPECGGEGVLLGANPINPPLCPACTGNGAPTYNCDCGYAFSPVTGDVVCPACRMPILTDEPVPSGYADAGMGEPWPPTNGGKEWREHQLEMWLNRS